MLRCALIGLLWAGTVSAQVPQFIEGVSIEPTGWMNTAAGIEMGVDHYGKDWALSRQVLGAVTTKGEPAAAADRWSLTGSFAGFDFAQTISAAGPNKLHYHVEVASVSGVQTSQLAFVVTLPVKLYQGKSVECDGKTIALPQTYGEEFLYQAASAQTLTIPTESGQLVIRNGNGIIIQDPRKYGELYQWYTIRLSFSPASGVLTQSAIDLDIELQPYHTEPIDIRRQANMGFADEEPADGKGGWTDQGPNNDIRMLPVGPKRFGGVLFDVIDPTANDGKSCLIFSGPERGDFLKSATIPVANKTFAYLYFLHAIAWAPKGYATVGHVQVDYADGSRQTIAVEFDRDVSNWWNVLPTENGDVVWTATNGSCYIGLYLARFAVENKPIAQLTLETTGNAVWMVAGISGGEAVPRLFVPNPVYTVEGETWTPYVYDLSVQPDSIMDFSHMNHTPAGKFGRVIATADGRFAFADAPETPVRFCGANLCFSANFQDRAACERLAQNAARMGYNTIRFHHFDCGIGSFSDAVCTLNPVELDKLDYLLYCLKQQGIYVSIDLFSDRAIGQGIIPEAPASVHHDLKALIPVLDSAMANWKAYTRSLLTHVNPYTQLAWKDDPTLFSICVDNEDNLTYWWDEWPYVRDLYDQRFAEWLAAEGKAGLDGEARTAAFYEFLAETQLKAYQECRDFIRSLGCDALLNDVNFENNALTRFVRPHLDYVDNHSYWAVPAPIHRHESLPVRSSHLNNLTVNASMARIMFNSRVFGRPFTVTEFNMPFPHRYRAQSGLTMGAYGALQDWNGLYRFAYAHTAGNTQQVGPTVWMELTQDPINMVSERIGILLFRRGDVQPARQAVPLALNSQDVFEVASAGDALEAYSNLGLRHRIGQWDFQNPQAAVPDSIRCAFGVAESSPLPPAVPYRRLTDEAVAALRQEGQGDSHWIASDTSEIALDPNEGQMTIVTDRSECFALEEGKALDGKLVSVKNRGEFSVVAVSAMDEAKPIAQAGRLLVCHLTDSSNSAARFFDEERTITEEWGTLPHLLRRGAADVTLRLDPAKMVRVWAITMGGQRQNEVPVRKTDGGFELTVDTAQPNGGCLTYEVVIE